MFSVYIVKFMRIYLGNIGVKVRFVVLYNHIIMIIKNNTIFKNSTFVEYTFCNITQVAQICNFQRFYD